MESPSPTKTITVIIPMFNEAGYIAKCIESVLAQTYPSHLIYIIVVDGGSTDGSTEIVDDYIANHQNIKLMGGPGVNCPTGMNIGVRNSVSDYIAKIDAHGYIQERYLSLCVDTLQSKQDVKCVGGLITPIPESDTGKANSIARSSVFGVGKGIYSAKRQDQYTDTVQCGVYERKALEEVGLFDDDLQFGEDEELNWRLRKSGYKIFANQAINFYYVPRNTLYKQFRQYFNYGKLRMRVVRYFLVSSYYLFTLFTYYFVALRSNSWVASYTEITGEFCCTALRLRLGITEGFNNPVKVTSSSGNKCFSIF